MMERGSYRPTSVVPISHHERPLTLNPAVAVSLSAQAEAAEIAAVQLTIEAILKAALRFSPGGVTLPWVLVLAL